MASLDEIEAIDKKCRDILDLSQIEIRSRTELKRLLEKIPDFKVRSEKVRTEDVIFDDDVASESSTEVCVKVGTPTDYPFVNPIPSTMREVGLKELGKVNISWRMLTLARPKSKLEEDFFGRLVQLEKLQYKTMQWEMEKELLKDKKGSSAVNSSKLRGNVGGRGLNRGSAHLKSAVAETRLQTCKECGVEFCYGLCKKFHYEDCARTFNPITVDIFEISRKKVVKSKKSVLGQSGFNLKNNNRSGETVDKPGSAGAQSEGGDGEVVTNEVKVPSSNQKINSDRSVPIKETHKIKVKPRKHKKTGKRKVDSNKVDSL